MRYGPNLLSLSCTCDKGEGEEWAVKREMETINYKSKVDSVLQLQSVVFV